MVQTREKSRRFSDLTYREIRECAQQGWLVVIPTGCTEQQGPHLPVDFDTWFAETLMVAAAEKTAQDRVAQVLVLPAMPLAPLQSTATLAVDILIFPWLCTMPWPKPSSTHLWRRDFSA